MSAFELYSAAASAAGGYFCAHTYNSNRSSYISLPVVTAFPVSRWEGARIVILERSCHLVIVEVWVEGGEAFIAEYVGNTADPTICTWTLTTEYMDQLAAAGYTVHNSGGGGDPHVKTYQ